MKATLAIVVTALTFMPLLGCERSGQTSESARLSSDTAASAPEEATADVQFRLAQRFHDGRDGVPPNSDAALAFYRKAADQGHLGAIWDLWRFYVHGKGHSGNSSETKAYFQQAAKFLRSKAEQEHAESQFLLGVLYGDGLGELPQDYALAINWFQKAEHAEPRARTFLGDYYRIGNGFAKDSTKAVEWYLKAAEKGERVAQNWLGWMYSNGDGVPKDARTAFEWFLKSAENGHSFSQLQVGWRYHEGVGVQKDLQKAVEWYRKSADNGNAEGQRYLAFSYLKGDGIPKDATLAFEWHSKAAISGDALSQSSLGYMYFNGSGTPKDVVLAYAWTNLAAAVGDETAIGNRNVYERQMQSDDIKEGQQLSSSWKKGTRITRAKSAEVTAADTRGEGPMTKVGNGTLFVVSTNGHGITNKHVVADCKEIRMPGSNGHITLVSADAANDLALIKMSEPLRDTATLVEEPGKLRQGDEIVVFGFPLDSVLSSGGNLTPGVVSALTGLGNNTSQLQITAPVQPGSSGSPVLNKKGEVVGVVTQKLSDRVMAKVTGSIAQNVSFAVNGHTLRAFLDANQVEFQSGVGFFAGDKSASALADKARSWTRVVECWK